MALIALGKGGGYRDYSDTSSLVTYGHRWAQANGYSVNDRIAGDIGHLAALGTGCRWVWEERKVQQGEFITKSRGIVRGCNHTETDGCIHWHVRKATGWKPKEPEPAPEPEPPAAPEPTPKAKLKRNQKLTGWQDKYRENPDWLARIKERAKLRDVPEDAYVRQAVRETVLYDEAIARSDPTERKPS